MAHPRRIAALLLASLALIGCSTAASTAPPSGPPAGTGTPRPTEASQPPESRAPATPAPSVEPGPPSASPTGTGTGTGDPAWRRIDPGVAPAAREDHTWTVDPGTGLAWLFGGRDGRDVRGDLWAFDLATHAWRAVEPANDGPPARFGHEAVWVDGLGMVVWAGQAGPTTFFDDLWAYDPAANRWARLPGDGERPLARYGSCAALGPDGRLWISHGFTEDGTRFADTRAYDFAARRWSDETPAGPLPVNRCLHGCWWSEGANLTLYGGQTTGVGALGDLWSMRAAGTPEAAWARAEGDLPDDRNLYAFAAEGDRIVVFGGRGLGSAYHRDLFAIDALTLAIEPLAPTGARPPGRSGATFIADPGRGRLLLFGGRNASRAFDDLWELAL